MTSTGQPPAQPRDRSRGCLIAAVHCPPARPIARLPATWPTGPLDQPAARVVAHARHLAAYPQTGDEPPSYVEELMTALTVAWGWNDAASRDVLRDGVHLLCAVPAGLLPGPLGHLGRRARLACAVLGGDATAQQASMVVAYAVAMAYRAASTRRVDRFDFCYRLAHLAADGRLAERLARVAALGDRNPDQAATHLLADGSDHARVSIGVAAFLRHPTQPAAAANFAAAVADPASTGIAAALAGAFAGTAALPHTWLRDTTRTAAISDASDALVALASCRQTLRSC